ncbi:MAG TPA: CDC27 family protein, partial [Candidatus Acidoferrum sp.]|nr:CDC27 family protein [Candidatus Acidoferrum sp.]
RMLWSGLAGVFILFLLPVLTLVSGHYPISFWETLRPELGMDWFIIRSVTSSSVWHLLGMVSVATLLPLLVISIRWSSNFGDSSRSSSTLVSYLFYAGHAGFLAMCIWLMFDPPFSPKQLPFAGAPGLTLYFVAALCLGYFCGFFLLVFGKKPQRSRRSPNQPDPALPQSLMWLCPLIVAGTLTVAIGGLALLIYKNIPVIRQMNDETLLNYARYATRNLPADGAILLVDNDAVYQQPIQAFIIKAMLAREGKLPQYPVVETLAAKDSIYQQFLHRQYPAIWPDLFKDSKHLRLSQQGMMQLVNQLAKSNNICYLNPSFGYYFEMFYQEPHGLNYRMKFLPADTLLPPALDAGLIRENEQLWSEARASAAPSIEAALTPPDRNRRLNFPDQLLARLHVTPDPNPNAVYVGVLYSRGLDYWGVQLQRGGELELAATNFLAAQSLNPDNRSAGINLEFNHELRTGKIPAIDFSLIAPDEYAKSHDWQQHISVDGPIDQVTFVYVEGLILSERAGLFRQSVAPFTRVRQLAPNRFDVRQRLANAYLLNHLPDRALEVLREPMTEPARFGLTEAQLTGLNTLMAAAYFQKNETNRGIALLESELARRPDDQALLTATIQTCLTMGFYTNALTLVDRQLKQTPNDPKWVFAQGLVNLRSGHYDPAIASLTRAIDLSTNNPTPRFHRALAYLDSGRLDQARADLVLLQANYTNSFQIAFGLGEIAWRKHDTNEAIRNYEIYLANAKTNTAEAASVIVRLRELQK